MAYGTNSYKGKFVPKNPSKYAGDASNITWRSSWELKMMKWCDTEPSVLLWASEETIIPYISPLDNKPHRYFVDFTVKVVDKHGTEHTYLFEVKPKKYAEVPVPPKRKTKQYTEQVRQYVVNQAKWAAARAFAAKNGVKFEVLTEDDLGIKR